MLQLIPQITTLLKGYPNISFKVQLRVDANFALLSVTKENEWSTPEVEISIMSRLTMMKNRWGIADFPPPLVESYIFPNETREQIIQKLAHAIKIVRSAKTIDINQTMRESSENQDKVMGHYQQTFVLTEHQCSELHRFFSPYRVPAGLTRSEVLACIKMCPERRRQLELYPMEFQPPAHPLLTQDIDEPISRTEGLKNAFYEIAIDLAAENDQSIFFS